MPWMTPHIILKDRVKRKASMRPRLIAVDDHPASRKSDPTDAASMRPRLIAVDDGVRAVQVGFVARASMRPRLIAVDDRVSNSGTACSQKLLQ